jgi:hypothetical protein
MSTDPEEHTIPGDLNETNLKFKQAWNQQQLNQCQQWKQFILTHSMFPQ